jgi:hypothetical protein
VLGDVGQPHHVRSAGGEDPTDEVVMGWGARLGSLRGLGFAEHRPPAVVTTDPPHDPVRHVRVTTEADLIGEEPIPELGVIAMRVEHALARYASSSWSSVIGSSSHR